MIEKEDKYKGGIYNIRGVRRKKMVLLAFFIFLFCRTKLRLILYSKLLGRESLATEIYGLFIFFYLY